MMKQPSELKLSYLPHRVNEMGEKEGQEIINKILSKSRELQDAASFISSVGEAFADEYLHENPSKETCPGREEVDRYYQKMHEINTKNMCVEVLKVFGAAEKEESIKFLEDTFFSFFEESWRSNKEDTLNSGLVSPWDNSERRTKIVIRVATRERMKNWDNTRNSGKVRSYDEIINDLLDIIPKSTDLSRANLPLRERQILKVLQGGNKTSDEVKLGLEEEGTELSLRAVQTNLSTLMRRGLVSRKRKGNNLEYSIREYHE